MFAYVFKTRADPYAGRINLFRVYQGTVTPRHAGAQHPRPPQGAHRPAAGAAGARRSSTPTRSARVTSARWRSSRRRRRATGWRRATSRSTMPSIKLPAPVMAFAIEPKAKGDEDKVFTALRRLQEEDPTIDLHRDAADRRADRCRAVADPRRGDRRPDAVALRRRGRTQAAAGAVPGDDPAAPRRTAATRSRPAAAASSATATSRSSRWPRANPSSSTRSRAA